MVADFGGLIGLVEAKVESSDPKLPAGSTIAGTLTWQLLEDKSPESKDYTASLQLQGSDNRVYYQKDIQIQDEGKGTSQLDKGTKITQTYAWDVDAQLEPGNYTLVVVVYNSYASNERLALQGGGTQKVLEEFVTAQ